MSYFRACRDAIFLLCGIVPNSAPVCRDIKTCSQTLANIVLSYLDIITLSPQNQTSSVIPKKDMNFTHLSYGKIGITF